MFKILTWELSRRQLEVLGQFTAVMAGSCFAPWRPMLMQTLAPYADLHNLLSPDLMLSLTTYLQMVHNMKAAEPAVLIFSLLPSLGVCLVVLIAFIVSCNFVGLYATQYLLDRVAENRVKATLS